MSILQRATLPLNPLRRWMGLEGSLQPTIEKSPTVPIGGWGLFLLF